jgi:hypothetical protein
MSEPCRLEKSLENLQMTIDKRLLNPEFWQSTSSIEDYCNAVLSNFDMSKMSVQVVFGNVEEGAYRVGNRKEKNVIVLPKVPSLITDANRSLFEKSIVFRSVVLRHELAHVIFTDTNKKSVLKDNEVKTVFACVEDSRVENLFSKTMKGSRYNFIRIAQPFYDIDRVRLEKVPSLFNLFYYFSYRCSEYTFTMNDITSVYESFYNKYKYIIDEKDCVSVYATYKAMYEEAEGLVFPLIKKYKEEKEKNKRKTSINAETSEEKIANMEAVSSDEIDESDSSVADGDLDEETEAKKNVDDTDISISEDEETGAKKNVDDTDISISEDEDGEANDKAQNGSDTQIETNKDVDDLFDEIENADDIDENANNFSILDALKHEYITASSDTGLIEFNDFEFNFDTIDSKVSELYASNLYKKTKSWGKLFNSNDGTTAYRKAVNEYSKAIGDLTRLFKLKIQSRTRMREGSYQEEGEIDQSNLQEFVINPASPRGFVKKIKSITPATNIVILLDISGSMSSNLNTVFSNCIIIMETCKRLGINYQVSMFSTRMPEIMLKDNQHMKERNIGHNIRISNSDDGKSQKISKMDKTIVTTIKRLEERHAPHHETILGNFYRYHNNLRRSWCGSTPEFYAVNHLYTNLKDVKNTIFFVINDGGYDSVDAFKEAEGHLMVRGIDQGFATTSYEDAINDIENRIMNLARIDNSEALAHYLNFHAGINLDSEFVAKLKDEVVAMMLEVTKNLKKKEVSARSCDEESNYKNIFYKSENQYANIDAHSYMKSGVLCINIGWGAKYVSESNFSNENGKEEYKKNKVKSKILESLNDQNDSATHVSHFLYRKFVEKMRKNNWRILGIGIRSDVGKHYIGETQFTMIRGANDLNTTFVKKLEKIF